MFGSFSGTQGSLFDEFWRLHHDLEEALADGLTSSSGIRSLPRGTFPAINVVQTPTEVQVYLLAPGIDPKQLNVSIQQNLLTIEGQRPRDESKATYYRQERFNGKFHRAISLSDDIDTQRVEAQYRDGIVQITLRRREAAKPRQIEIH